MLSLHEIETYREHIRQIHSSHEFIDIHTHPFDVVCNRSTYQQHPKFAGILSCSRIDYSPPRISAGMQPSSLSDRCKSFVNEEVKSRCVLLQMHQCYLHIGPQVFSDHMELSGVDRILLLPVAGSGLKPINDQLLLMRDLFGSDPRFIFGYSVPNEINNQQINDSLASAVCNFKVKAIKIHPAITELNLGSADGLERMAYMLNACSLHGLSVIIHGGRSPAVLQKDAREFGGLDNLQKVDWSVAGNPVIIAHAGLYGYEAMTDIPQLLKKLRWILDRHDNVLADVSGITLPILQEVMTSIDANRLVFGSDSLYYPQWKVLAELYHALCKSGERPDDRFAMIVSNNPKKVVGESGGENSPIVPHGEANLNSAMTGK